MKTWKTLFTPAKFQTLLMTNYQLIKNADLKDFCTFHIGGKAKFLYIVYSNPQLLDVCKHCNKHNIKYKIIGLGANLLFDDLGFDGAIIVNKCNDITIKNTTVWVDAGVNLTSLILTLKQHGLGGFEALCGIPSTIGGGVVNNVGAFGVELGEFVKTAEVRKKDDISTPLFLNNLDCKFAYRDSIFKHEDYIITRVLLQLQQKDICNIEKNIDKSISSKTATQPLNEYSAGSIFKRSNIIPAKIIDDLGLKGLSIGNAQISQKHSGFIVNNGYATAQNVKDLISFIQNQVYLQTNEKIELEIEFVEP